MTIKLIVCILEQIVKSKNKFNCLYYRKNCTNKTKNTTNWYLVTCEHIACRIVCTKQNTVSINNKYSTHEY